MDKKSRQITPPGRNRSSTSQVASAREAMNSTTGSRGFTVRRPASEPTGKRRPVTADRKSRGSVKQMDTNPVGYWNAQAKGYDDKIFSSIDADRNGIIAGILDKFSEKEDRGPWSRCVDLGCGAGKYLPHLAKRFSSVTGFDLSPRLVDVSRKEVLSRNLLNVEVRVKDLSEAWFSDRGTTTTLARISGSEDFECYGFAVMANVLIAPVSDYERQIMLRNALDALCSGGRLLVIVPSMESALYVGMRCSEVGFSGPYKGPPRLGDAFARSPNQSEAADMLKGICKRYGVRTKHYLEPEFHLLAVRMGFTVEICEKLTYRWSDELSTDSDAEIPLLAREPDPLPWDWLFLLRKGGARSTTPGARSTTPQQGWTASVACEEPRGVRLALSTAVGTLASDGRSTPLTPRTSAAIARLPVLSHHGPTPSSTSPVDGLTPSNKG